MLQKTPQKDLRSSSPQAWPAMDRGSLEASEPRIFHAVLGSVAQQRGLSKLNHRRKDITYANFDGSPKMVLVHEYLGVAASEVRNFGVNVMTERHHIVKYSLTTEGGDLLSEGKLYCVAA